MCQEEWKRKYLTQGCRFIERKLDSRKEWEIEFLRYNTGVRYESLWNYENDLSLILQL